jgi:solute carrier family 25 (mitochondrial uncoupling protein), member 8/9
VIRHIVATSGIAGLWRGTVPSMARASLLTASQCATYDVVKQQVVTNMGGVDSLPTQVTAGAITGIITTTITSPADLLKTKMFAMAPGGATCGGLIATTAQLIRDGGAGVFFKGWMANYARLGPQTLIIFLVSEQLRYFFGLDAL